MTPTHPRPDGKGERTRQRILVAARECFGRVGYERATIRMIAAAADADKSSVINYFGTKQQLFREAVYFDIPIDQAYAGDPASSVENMLRGMLDRWATTPSSPEAVLTRTSMTSEEAADLMRQHITEFSISAITRNLPAEVPDARLRAALFSVMMFGLASGIFLLELPDLTEAPLEDLIRIATPALSALLGGDPA